MQQRNEQRDCATTLTEIVIAKEAYAVKHSLASNVPITMDELLKDNAFNGVAPVCPAGGSYTIGSIDQRPTCSIDGHQIEWVEATPMPIISSQTAQTSPRSSVTLPQTSSETIVTTNSTHATE